MKKAADRDFRRLLDLLPALAAGGPPLYSVKEMSKDPGGKIVLDLDPYEYSEAVRRWIDDACATGFVLEGFDWPAWKGRAEELVANPELLARADLDTLRKLVTTHVRQERFCSGHLAAMLDRGHVAELLKRLAQVLAGPT